MSDLQGDIDRGHKAQKLLDDPILTRAFADVEAAIHEAWSMCPLRDREGAHELKLELKLLGDLRANIERAVSDGKLAAHELDQQRRVEQTHREWAQKV